MEGSQRIRQKDLQERRNIFTQKFEDSREVLSALGDPNRQLILKMMIEHCGEGGLRVGEIRVHTNISRTAVSHHLKVLMEAGVIMCRKVGTMNFYYLDAGSSSLKKVIAFWKEAQEMMAFCEYMERGK